MEVQNQTPLPMYKPSTYLIIRCHDQGWIMEILTRLLEIDVEDHGLIMLNYGTINDLLTVRMEGGNVRGKSCKVAKPTDTNNTNLNGCLVLEGTAHSLTEFSILLQNQVVFTCTKKP